MTPLKVCLIGCVIAIGVHPSIDAYRQSTPTRADIEQSLSEALAAYAAGNAAAVADWMASPIGARTVVSSGEIGRIVLASPEPWSRSTAAFLLELAAAITSRQPFRAPGIIDAGRTYLLMRPEAPGADAAGDQFEWLWHQAAIAVTQDIRQHAIQQAYLDAIAPRLDVAIRHGVAMPPRLPLARAIAAAGLCCWKNVPGAPIQFIRPPVRSSLTLRDALARFEQAAEIPALRAEALIRGAVLLYKSGRAADALAWFDRVPPHTDANSPMRSS